MNTAKQQPVSERRERTRKEIKQLIADRNCVLSQYYSLVNCADEAKNCEEPILDLLQEFCQELIDYLATSHFEIYRRIEDGEERRDDIVELANGIFDKITLSTAVAVAFNDLYDSIEGNAKEAIKDLPTQLSKLGQSLATRIELEDKFINALLIPAGRPALQVV